jgi:hypothetical protein
LAEQDLDVLLKRMPEMAQAVNAFQSPELQREAFEALVAAFKGHTTQAGASQQHTSQAQADKPAPSPAAGKGGKPPRQNGEREGRKRGGFTPTILRDLNLSPAGKKSFNDFVKEKQPKSNEDRYAVAVYWLEHEAQISPITFNHVATIFRVTPDWKEPINIQSGLTTAASRKNTINTKDFEDIKTTPTGRNFVEHELPPKKTK